MLGTNEPVLIAWHHGTLPQIIEALGGDPHAVLPDGYWPDSAFNYVTVLRYDHEGKLIPGSEQLINEDFANPPGQIKRCKFPMKTPATSACTRTWAIAQTIGFVPIGCQARGSHTV